MGAGPLRRLNAPVPVAVRAGRDGLPRAVTIDGRPRRVSAVREDWRVQDRWWTDDPIDRHYAEVVLDGGRCLTVYRDARRGTWFRHG